MVSAGFFVATLGHKHPRLMGAMQQQMETLSFVPSMHGIADITLDFIEKLGEVTPGNLNYIKPYSGRLGVDRVRHKVHPSIFQAERAAGKIQVHQPILRVSRGQPSVRWLPAAPASAKLRLSLRWGASSRSFHPPTTGIVSRLGRSATASVHRCSRT